MNLRNFRTGSVFRLLFLFCSRKHCEGTSGKIASLITRLNLHEPTCTSLIAQPNSHEPTYTSQLTRANLHEPICSSQLAQPTYTSQLARANLHKTTYTSQLARANLHESTCTSQLTRANLHENNLHEISHSQTCTRHFDMKARWGRTRTVKMTPFAGIGAVDVQKLETFYDVSSARATLCGDWRGRCAKTGAFYDFCGARATGVVDVPKLWTCFTILAHARIGAGDVQKMWTCFTISDLPARPSAGSMCKS